MGSNVSGFCKDLWVALHPTTPHPTPVAFHGVASRPAQRRRWTMPSGAWEENNENNLGDAWHLFVIFMDNMFK